MAIGLVFSLLLLLRAVSTGQTACSGPLILVVSENAKTERAASTLVEYANGSSRGTCIAIDQDSNLTSSETCSATTGVDVGFCNFVLDNFSGISYTVRTECANTSTNPEDTFANREELCSTVTKITDYLGDFKSILDRTLVDVYLRSCQEKTVCLVSWGAIWLLSCCVPFQHWF